MGSQAFDGVGRDQVFKLDVFKQVRLIGVDTDDGPEHILHDDRIHKPLDLDLVENILLLKKVLEPIAVRKSGEFAEVVYGVQRTRALRVVNTRLLEMGVPEDQLIRMPCMIDKSTDLQLLLRKMSENTQRRGDSPMQRARNIQRCLDFGAPEKDLAIVFKLSVPHLRAQTALLNLDKHVQKLVDSERLNASAAINLAALEREEQVTEADRLVASGHTTVADVRQATRQAQARKRGGSTEDIVKAPSKRELRRVIETNAALPEDDRLDPGIIKGIRIALGDLSPASVKGLTAMMAPAVDAAE